jgi:hypothetical protein
VIGSAAVLAATACGSATESVGPSQHPPFVQITATPPETRELYGLTLIGWQGGSPHLVRFVPPFGSGATERTVAFPGAGIAPFDSLRIVTEVEECGQFGAVDTVLTAIPESQITTLALASPPSPLAALAPGEVACGGGEDPRSVGVYYFRLRVDAVSPVVEGYWTIDFSRTHRGWHGRWTTTPGGQQLTLTLEGTPGDPPCGPTTAHVEMQGDGMARITFVNPEGCIVPDVPTPLYAEKPWPGVPQP